MATSEALVKYYECLKDSFNKIQDKNNEAALINAALRPKICEEFAKSHEVLISYLNYIQVFSVIYSDKFKAVCSEIIVPLFRESVINTPRNDESSDCKKEADTSDKASRIHETIKTIIEDRSNLTNDFVLCIVKAFPSISGDSSDVVFKTYLRNSLEVCKNLHGEPLNTLLTKILEKITPSCFLEDSEEKSRIGSTSEESYGVVYDFLDKLETPERIKMTKSIIRCFIQEFMRPPWNDQMSHLILYICSLGHDLVDYLTDLLQSVFRDTNRPIEERMASMIFSSSFLARSKFVDLEKVLNHIECMTMWCDNFLEQFKDMKHVRDGISENVDAFRAVVISISYLVTQRYREMYEKETIDRLVNLNLDKIIHNTYTPLDFADRDLRQRFNEVTTLYHIARPYETRIDPNKRRKSEHVSSNRLNLALPLDESPKIIPERVKQLYRVYYNHRNFTIVRE